MPTICLTVHIYPQNSTYQCDMHLLLSNIVDEEKERLADMSNKLKQAKVEARIRLRERHLSEKEEELQEDGTF